MAVKLGSKVRDMISGITGTAVSRTEFLYGCTRIGVETTELKDGRPVECWFDEQRVEVVEEKAAPMSPASTARTGGPQNDAPLDRRI